MAPQHARSTNPETDPGSAPGTTGLAAERCVTVRYWAGARAAAGVDAEQVPLPEGATLATVIATVLERHRDRSRFADVVAVSSVLLGEQPVGSADPASVVPRPGDTVEILPPFAGG